MKQAIAALALVFIGCDGEFERLRERSEVNERIRLQCVPEPGERVLVGWDGGNKHLVCWHFDPHARQPGTTAKVVAGQEEVMQ